MARRSPSPGFPARPRPRLTTSTTAASKSQTAFAGLSRRTMPPLRLLEVAVQPTFVGEVDGELVKFTTPPQAVSAKSWPAYSSEGFRELEKAAQEQFTAAAEQVAG